MIPPRIPPQLLVFVTTLPSLYSKGSLDCEPRILESSKPLPNSMPFIAGTPKTAFAITPSTPSNIGSPMPASIPLTAHSIVPPILSWASLADSTSARIFSSTESSISAKELLFNLFISLSSIETGLKDLSFTLPMLAIWAAILIPFSSRIWRQIAPAKTIGAVSLPEKWPPPRISLLALYLT